MKTNFIAKFLRNVKMGGGGNSEKKCRGCFFAAFTLVELLVVIAIIGVLIALLLPAVQAAREAARRMQCSNKMKQLSLGAMNYHDIHALFPAGSFSNELDNGTGIVWPNSNSVWSYHASWGVSLLPFLEQQAAFDMYNPKASLANNNATAYPPGKNRELAESRMTIFECPSDLGAGNKQISRSEAAQTDYTPKLNVNMTSYRGVGGASTSTTWFWDQAGYFPRLYQRGIYHFVGPRLNSTAGGDPPRGYSLKQESISSVLDGTTNVVAFVEHHVPDMAPERGTFWSLPPVNHIYTSAPKTSTLKSHKWDTCLATTGQTSPNDIYTCNRSAGAYHIGGMNAALVDGSVRFVSDTINVGTGAYIGDRVDIGVWGSLCGVDLGGTKTLP
ncbi:MAG: DUF1559 domain-containing protein [Thermoguttaceae bacterium]